jgi:hypothetical protein
MNHDEMPQMTKMAYTASGVAGMIGAMQGGGMENRAVALRHAVANPDFVAALQDRARAAPGPEELRRVLNNQQNKGNQIMTQNTTRLVRIYVADTDPNVPIGRRLLYTGSEQLTDSTDQELFYTVPIPQLLTDHNIFRSTLTDKAQSAKFGRDVILEPIRVRDLKMVIVDIAVFA